MPDSRRQLHHQFGETGEVYLSQLAGSPRQLFDVWRQELGLKPLNDAEFAALARVPMLGGEATLLDASGRYTSMQKQVVEDARLLVALVEHAGEITFVKLVARSDEAIAQREAFLGFCAAVQRQP